MERHFFFLFWKLFFFPCCACGYTGMAGLGSVIDKLVFIYFILSIKKACMLLLENVGGQQPRLDPVHGTVIDIALSLSYFKCKLPSNIVSLDTFLNVALA